MAKASFVRARVTIYRGQRVVEWIYACSKGHENAVTDTAAPDGAPDDIECPGCAGDESK